MSTEPEVLAKVETALNAFEEFKSSITPRLEKLDVLDKAKLDKVSDAIAVANEAKMAADAAKKSADDMLAAMKRPALSPTEGDERKALEKKLSTAFNEFARKDNPNRVYFEDYALSKGIEKKDLTVGIDPDGGFTVMAQFNGIVQTRIFETSPIRTYATVETISTDALEFLDDDDEAADGGWVAETGTRSGTDTPELRKRRIPVHEMYAQPSASQKILDDSIVDIEQWLARKVADKMARKENTAFVSGNGVTAPRGFLGYDAWSVAGTYESGKVEQVVSGAAGAITYDGLVDLQNALKEAYQPGARFMLKRSAFKDILKIKDGESTPIFNMGYDKSSGIGFNILGKPVVFADDMPAVGASTLSVVYADFARFYCIVDRVGIRILRDPFTNKPYVKFYTTKRVGGDVLNFEAGKILKLAAS